jgi:hypothetical protein
LNLYHFFSWVVDFTAVAGVFLGDVRGVFVATAFDFALRDAISFALSAVEFLGR